MPFSSENNQGSLVKWSIPGLKQENNESETSAGTRK